MGFYGSNEPTLDFQILANKSYPAKLEIILYLSFSIAYDVKLPIIPFHAWLFDTHGKAHYNTCMLGIIQINMELLFHAPSIFAPWLVVIGAIQIVCASLTEKKVDSQSGFQKKKGFQDFVFH
jgi:NAD(P)H-quinone oxidoreductase subunit 4